MKFLFLQFSKPHFRAGGQDGGRRTARTISVTILRPGSSAPADIETAESLAGRAEARIPAHCRTLPHIPTHLRAVEKRPLRALNKRRDAG